MYVLLNICINLRLCLVRIHRFVIQVLMLGRNLEPGGKASSAEKTLLFAKESKVALDNFIFSNN